MSQLNLVGQLPGMTAASTTVERNAILARMLLLPVGVVISSAARDSGSSPTTDLRHGLVLGKITSSGLYTNYSATATDGSQVAQGVLLEPRSVLSFDGTATNVVAPVLFAGYLKASELTGIDYLARRQLATRFIFDDYPTLPTTGPFSVVAKTANYTLTAADVGKCFTNTGAAGAVVFTLPTAAPGYVFEFFVTANQTVTITAPSGKLIAFNNAAATSAAWSTSNEKIGQSARVIMNDAGDKYMLFPAGGGTVTIS